MRGVFLGVLDEISVPVERFAGFAFEVVLTVDFDETEAWPETLVPFKVVKS